MSLPRPCCLNPLIIPGTPRGSLAYFDKEEKSIKWYYAKPTRVQREDTALVLFYDVFGFNLVGEDGDSAEPSPTQRSSRMSLQRDSE